MSEEIKDKIPAVDLKQFRKIIFFGGFILLVFMSVYTVDANENAVMLRLGKYYDTTGPGLGFKIPLIDEVHKVRVDYQYKKEFGFRTLKSDKKSVFKTRGFEDESWMLTGDLNIADVRWIIQFKIKDAADFLFNVRDVENTIRDVSEATMRLMIGDRSFTEVLQSERENINIIAKLEMQKILVFILLKIIL